jgi:hypothetical protein
VRPLVHFCVYIALSDIKRKLLRGRVGETRSGRILKRNGSRKWRRGSGNGLKEKKNDEQ